MVGEGRGEKGRREGREGMGKGQAGAPSARGAGAPKHFKTALTMKAP